MLFAAEASTSSKSFRYAPGMARGLRWLGCLVMVGVVACGDSEQVSAGAGAGGVLAAGGEGGAAGEGGAGGEAGASAGTAGAAGAVSTKGLVPACLGTTAAPAFSETSKRWGLSEDALNVQGNRLMTADLDGDGYPDLIVHRIGSTARTDVAAAQADSKKWQMRLLMNRPAPGGGRTFVDATVDSHYGALATGDDGKQLRLTHLAAAADVDNDGDLDLFAGTAVDPTADLTKTPDTGDRSQILLNDGHGVFSLAPPSDTTPKATSRWPLTGATFVDADRDGTIDLFVGFWYKLYGSSDFGVQAQLYRGNGDGSFTAVTNDAGLKTVAAGSASFGQGTNARPAYGVTSCDLDDDGDAELMVSAYGRQWNLLYRNDGHGVFSEVGQASGYAGDDNRDYSDNEFFACYCTLHADQADCKGVGQPQLQCPDPADAAWNEGSDAQPWRSNGNTFSTFCGDIDGDGRNDLYNAEIAHWWAGQAADKSQVLRNVSDDSGLRFDRLDPAKVGTQPPHATPDWNEGGIYAAGADLDNDGRLDLFLGTTDYPDQFGYFFHQKADGTFVESSEAWTLRHACASGVAIADFDRDGDLDVILGAGTARDCGKIWPANRVVFYENDASQKGASLSVRLRGTTANAAGIGASVVVVTGGGELRRDVGGGYGHMAMQHDTVVHFGLGACTQIDSVRVRWPTDPPTEQVVTGVTPGGLVEITEGVAESKKILP